ncbi:unnamed protein product [Linum tenue]|uniref:Uncharacterized protein n=1 Tax=Linum tenue TaxID=586396 RepID=A0AAV0INM2_9ROSI|nr:unnamed protein product [Linum tenue]
MGNRTIQEKVHRSKRRGFWDDTVRCWEKDVSRNQYGARDCGALFG